MAGPPAPYDVLVIGGGVNGLAALYHLGRLGAGRLGLVERFRIGHDRASSHGTSRITRSTYPEADYVRLAGLARAEEWPRLEREAGARLLHPAPGCFFGPPGRALDAHAAAVAAAGARVERLSPAEGRRRFPMFRFEGAGGVLLDHTAAVVDAAGTLAALARLCRARGAEIREETRVLGIDLARDPIEAATEGGTIRARRLVVAAGAWAGALLPFLRPRLSVTRQTVGYFVPEGPAGAFAPGRFPVWIYLADGVNSIFYGLPAFGREGIKAARHVTSGADDPEEPPRAADPGRLADIEAFLARELALPLRRRAGAEHCLYTNTATEDFILDLHPEDARVAVGAGFSGHGFKFGPLTGRILAELVRDGRTSLPEFERARARFAAGGP